MRAIAGMIDRVLRSGASDPDVAAVQAEVRAMCEAFPLYEPADAGSIG
jgi:glycine/serine hydroxymethyltransferase